MMPPQIPPQTNHSKPAGEPLSRAKLEFMLTNGEEMVDVVERHIKQFSLPYIVVNSELKDTLSQGQIYLNSFITIDPSTMAMKSDAKLMAQCKYEVLIAGETGTGKELIAASMIGERTGRIKAVNCAGFPSELIESELFGHAKGAFTGATTDKNGLMADATGGVMFLDEIGELPMFVQAKLLRALQEKRIRKVGSNVDMDIDCKFVCATHRNLKKMVDEGTFRRDLYARLSTLELDIKPLRDRRCDIVPITESLEGGKKFLEKYRNQLLEGTLKLPLNVRSIQQYVIRYNILGKVEFV